MANLDPQDLRAVATQRQSASRILDQWGHTRDSYMERDERVHTIDLIAAGLWHVVWPDRKVSRALPKIPNVVVMAAEHRARLVAENLPSLMVRPELMKDDAKQAAEKRERVLHGYWYRNRLPVSFPYWAMDLMYTGLAICKVMPDFAEKDKTKRFPVYTRIDPRNAYPGPVFARGPFPEDMIVTYEESVATVERRFGRPLAGLMSAADKAGLSDVGKVRVLEYADAERYMVVAETIVKNAHQRPDFEVLRDERHDLGRCPYAIGVRPSHDGAYRGDFDHVIALLNTHNKLMTLHLDAAAGKVYPSHGYWDVSNPDEFGPDSLLEYKSQEARFDTIGEAAAPYDNYNILRMLSDFERDASLLPKSATGDPDQSIISAAGVTATQSMPNAEVVSLQRDSIAPMLQAANELALRADERWADVEKTINGVQRGAAFAEKYRPSKDIDGHYSNEVVYGMGSGLDKINHATLVLTAQQAGTISERTARELHPLVQDPVREEKQYALEQLDKATFAGLVAAASAPPGDPRGLDVQTLAAIRRDLENEEVSLHEAIEKHTQRIPLAQPAPTAQVNAASPGVAGAAEPLEPALQGPSLADLGLGA